MEAGARIKRRKRKMSRSILLTLAVLLNFYLFIYYQFFYKTPSEEFPRLRHRLGTILYHSDTEGSSLHYYCYYPKSTAMLNQRSGEYLIKRVNSYGDCKDWYGVSLYKEGAWVSEIEKIWWNKAQMELDSGNLAETSPTSKEI